MTNERSILQLGIRAAKANAIPAIILWAAGAFVVGAYYLWPTARPAFDRITAWRDALGMLYPMLSTALFAGIIPYLMQGLQQRDAPRRWGIGYFSFLMVFWAIKGVEIDLLYRLQAWLFGHGQDAGTLASKVLFDQLVYGPFWGVPTLVIAMLFAQADFSRTALRDHLRRGWYRYLILPIMIPNWFVWVPSATFIYLLPTPLQLPLQNLVTCLWVLMVMFMTGQQTRSAQERAQG